jgi:sortase (surface protein transpeptidase)
MPRHLILALLALGLLATACGPKFDIDAVSGPPAQMQVAAATVTQEVAAPAELAIPSLGTRSPLMELGLEPDRTIQVPEDPDLAGWYTGGPKPGETGPAVIVGHVDSYTGPGVFHRLGELAPGEEILIRRQDGSVARFAVTRVEQHPKDDFPTEAVYGDTDGRELRLVTCGGAFDRSARSYTDNVIVWATLAD